MLDDAVSELKASGCDRLIIDLRGNIGGSLGFARLASYLCADRRPIGHSLTPSRFRTGYRLEELPRVPMPANPDGSCACPRAICGKGQIPHAAHSRFGQRAVSWPNGTAR